MGPVEAFRANASTFYDLPTGRKHSLWLRYLCIFGFGAVLQWCGFRPSPDSLDALITVLGVLLGFGYSVQFYLAGTSLPEIARDDYLEDVGDKRLLSRTSSEVYDNVVYLNYAILMGLLPPFSLTVTMPEFLLEPAWIKDVMVNVGGAATWVLALEVFATFYRVLARSSFFFSERRRLGG